MIEEFLDRLEILARAAGLDADRVVTEIADHLSSAIAAHEAGGCERTEAESRALATFGDAPAIVATIRSETVRPGSVVRSAGAILSLLSLAALWFAHVSPAGDLSGTAQAPLSVVALAALLGAVVLLTGRDHPALAGLVALLSGGVVWAFATSLLRDLDVVVMNVSFTLGTAALLTAALCIAGNIRGAVGFAAIASGAAALILNGSWSELGGFGAGNGNSAVMLLTFGCLWVTAVYGGPRRLRRAGTRARASAASLLERIARHVAPHAVD